MATPLIKKLGIKSGMRICIMNQPSEYSELLGELPDDVELLQLEAAPHFIHFFALHAGQLAADLDAVLKHLGQASMLWISWPKKSSGIETDIDGNVIRSMLRPRGLIDVKVCAVDEVWSAVKFVWRKENRR